MKLSEIEKVERYIKEYTPSKHIGLIIKELLKLARNNFVNSKFKIGDKLVYNLFPNDIFIVADIDYRTQRFEYMLLHSLTADPLWSCEQMLTSPPEPKFIIQVFLKSTNKPVDMYLTTDIKVTIQKADAGIFALSQVDEVIKRNQSLIVYYLELRKVEVK